MDIFLVCKRTQAKQVTWKPKPMRDGLSGSTAKWIQLASSSTIFISLLDLFNNLIHLFESTNGHILKKNLDKKVVNFKTTPHSPQNKD